jgi:hypothetical protein
MKFLTMIAHFFGSMLSVMWATIAREARKPQEVRQLGDDPATRAAVENNIAKGIIGEDEDDV